MPIKREVFENGNFVKRRHSDRSQHPVALVLSKNTGLAYTVKELSKETKMNEDTVRSMLGSLAKDGLVVHKTPYFAWKVSNKKKPSKAKAKSVKRTKAKKKKRR